jgi:hypothetical protein
VTRATPSGPFWRCACGHPLYEHARRVVPNAGIQEYVGCHVAGCGCRRYEAQDGSKWPQGPAGKP